MIRYFKTHLFFVVLLVLSVFHLSGCTIDTTTTYNKTNTNGFAKSEPIYLSFYESKHAAFYFILKHKIATESYSLYVYWNSPDRDSIFDTTNSGIKFIVNNSDIITLKAKQQPKIIAYNIENNGHVEEAVFDLTFEQMKMISNAKTVTVELTGRHITVIGRFNKLQTFKAFKNFLENAH